MSDDFTPRQALGVIDSPVILLTAASNGQKNVMSANMVMGTSFSPILLAVSVSTGSFTHRLIEESDEFVVNVAGTDQLGLVETVGRESGLDVDKFDEYGIETSPADEVGAPLISGCPAAIECKVVDGYPTGEHTLFVGHVVALHRAEGRPLLMYRGDYYEPGSKLGKFSEGEAA